MNRRGFIWEASACATLSLGRICALAQVPSQGPEAASPEQIKAWMDAVQEKEFAQRSRVKDLGLVHEGAEAADVKRISPDDQPDMVLLQKKRIAGIFPSHDAYAVDTTDSVWDFTKFSKPAASSDTIVIRGLRNTSAFADAKPMYYTLNPITVADVTVPAHFVTDLTSVPAIFYSKLRPDGPYAYAAIVHDWLYWQQTGRREDADWLLKRGMVAFNVSAFDVNAIYLAVSTFGQSAWNQNAKLKTAGEKRLLRVVPDDPRMTWEEWKRSPEHFA